MARPSLISETAKTVLRHMISCCSPLKTTPPAMSPDSVSIVRFLISNGCPTELYWPFPPMVFIPNSPHSARMAPSSSSLPQFLSTPLLLRPRMEEKRGSIGYGQKFIEMNRGDWGGGDFKDVMA